MNKENLLVVSFDIILHSGNARTMLHEAFELMREGEFLEAEKKLDDANNELMEAHKAQTSLLQDYVNGEEIVMEVIIVHTGFLITFVASNLPPIPASRIT